MKKLVSYLKALFFIMVTILMFTGTEYDKLITPKDIIFYSLINGNLVLLSFYHTYKFLKEMN